MRVLIVHALRNDSRLTTVEHALSFGRHLRGCEVTYVNIFGRATPAVTGDGYDLAILTYELLAQRSMPFWGPIARRVEALMRSARVSVAMPQDDYTCSALLDDFITRNGIGFVLTPLTRDLHLLYPKSIACGVQFHEALTGYWETETRVPISSFRKPFEERQIDVGQRVRNLPPHFGHAAQRKGQLAISFAAAAMQTDFVCDVSTDSSAVLIGNEWWKFLGNIRFTIGRRGGASVADPKGRLQARANQLQLRNPRITYDQIAHRLKTNALPQGDFTAISPRLFECAAMGVCQILEEDHYINGLEPWTHYIPITSNLSNIKDVFAAMRDWSRCKTIVANAEDVLIKSGKYTYREFVRRLAATTVGHDTNTSADPVVIDLDEHLFIETSSEFVDRVQSVARRLIMRNQKLATDSVSEFAREWLLAYRRDELIVESFTIPWCPATPLMASS